MHAERLGLLLAVFQMYRLVRKDLRGGRDYVHNIVYHQLGGFCVSDVRAHQARKILVTYEYGNFGSYPTDCPYGRTGLSTG